MKARVPVYDLKAACKVACTTVVPANRAIVPALSHLLLGASDGRLEVAGTTLEVYTCQSIQAKVDEDGGVCVPAKAFADFVGTLDDDEVCALTWEGDGKRCILKCGKARGSFVALSPEEFPQKQKRSKLAWEIEAPGLVRSLNAVMYAAAEKEEDRQILETVHIVVGDEAVRFEAADGYRVARANEAVGGGGGREFTIPVKVLENVVAFAKKAKVVRFFATTNKAMMMEFECPTGTVEIFTQEVIGEYVELEGVIPKQFEVVCDCDTDELRRAIGVIASVSKQRFANVALAFGAEELQLRGMDADVSVCSTLLCSTEGRPCTTVMRLKFLRQAVAACDSDALAFKMNPEPDSDKVYAPILVAPRDDEWYISVMMPLPADADPWQVEEVAT